MNALTNKPNRNKMSKLEDVQNCLNGSEDMGENQIQKQSYEKCYGEQK